MEKIISKNQETFVLFVSSVVLLCTLTTEDTEETELTGKEAKSTHENLPGEDARPTIIESFRTHIAKRTA